MYGRMQFADFIVSWALQALSRSLLKVSETQRSPENSAPSPGFRSGPGVEPGPAGLRPSDAKSLNLTAERIFSLWQMAQWSVSKLEFERARADLKQIIELTAADKLPEQIAAERLLERLDGADPRTSRLLVQIIEAFDLKGEDRAVPGDRARESLSELLQRESGRWRSSLMLRQINEQSLVEHGMLRAFAKASSLTGRLNAISAEKGERASRKRLLRTGRWVKHAVNHLELLRPALSDTGRTRRWHLNRLAAKLDEQWALEILARSAVAVDLRPKAAARLDALIGQERKRLEKQRQKLSLGAFAGGSDAYRVELIEAVAQLGLEDITLLPVEGIGLSAK